MQYMGRDPREEYLKQNVMTAGPAGLVAMLYEACAKNLRLAKISYEDNKDICATSNYLLKAQSIIGELVASLDMSVELSTELIKIYEFMLTEMRNANVKKDLTGLDHLISMLTSMRDTWQQLDKMQRKNMTMEC